MNTRHHEQHMPSVLYTQKLSHKKQMHLQTNTLAYIHTLTTTPAPASLSPNYRGGPYALVPRVWSQHKTNIPLQICLL